MPDLLELLSCLRHGHDPGLHRDWHGRPTTCQCCGRPGFAMREGERERFFGRALIADAQKREDAARAGQIQRMGRVFDRAAERHRDPAVQGFADALDTWREGRMGWTVDEQREAFPLSLLREMADGDEERFRRLVAVAGYSVEAVGG